MQTHLIIRALKVTSPQGQNEPIVPPQEKHDDEVKDVGADHLCPDSFGENVHGCHEGKTRGSRNGRCIALGEIDCNQDTTAKNAQHEKNISHHLGASQEHHGI